MNELYNSFYQYISEHPQKQLLIYHYIYGIAKKHLKEGKAVIGKCESFLSESTNNRSQKFADYAASSFGLAISDYAKAHPESYNNAFIKKERSRKKRRFLSLVLVSLLLLLQITAIIFYPPLNYRVLSFYGNRVSRSDFIDIKYTTEENRQKLSEFQGDYMPTVIPRGYTVSTVKKHGDIYTIQYKGATSDDRIVYTYYRYNSELGVDTERPDSKTLLLDNGQKAYITKSGDRIIAVWNNNLTLIKIGLYGNQTIDMAAFINSVELLRK